MDAEGRTGLGELGQPALGRKGQLLLGRSAHSNLRERLYARRRRLHARIVNVRNDLHHKATTAIAKSAGRVVIGDLNVAGMMSNRRLSRALADAGISGFLVESWDPAKLEYQVSSDSE